MKQKSKPVLALFLALIFLFSCTAQQKKPEPKPVLGDDGPPIPIIVGEEPLNEMVQSNFTLGNYACEKAGYLPGDMSLYNQAYQSMEWISAKKGLEYKKIIPICYGKAQTMLIKNFDNNSKEGSIRKAIGLFVEVNDKAKVDNQTQTDSRGFYSSGDEMMVINKELKQDVRNGVLTHELVHALQDQHYRTDFRHASRSGYKMSAEDTWVRQSLYEGEAKLLQKMFLAEKDSTNYKLLGVQEGREEIKQYLADKKIMQQTEVLDDIWYNLVYEWSGCFLRDLMGGEYDGEFMKKMMEEKTYPVSTEQLIDIEKYRAGEDHKKYNEFSQDPFDKFFEASKLISSDGLIWSLGQGQMSALARIYVESDLPLELAKGWNGDRTLVYAKKDKEGNFNWKESVFVHETSWDDEASLGEWTKNAVKIFQKKYPNGFEEIASGANAQVFEFDFEGSKRYAAIVTDGTSCVAAERLYAETEEDLENFVNTARQSMAPAVAKKDDSN